MSSSHTSAAELKQQVLGVRKAKVRGRKGSLKLATVAAYAGVFLLVMSMVAIGYQPPQKIASVSNAVTSSSVKQPSVDELVATNVAAGIAERADLPVASNVANLSVSLAIESQLAQTDNNVITKPQIVQPTADSRDIIHYKAKAGDTVQKLSNKFGVDANTIRWANDLGSDSIEKGKALIIPPVNGVIYTVAADDTIDSIAQKYGANKQQIITFNDLELTGVQPNKKIIIPGGNMPEEEEPAPEPTAPVYTQQPQSTASFTPLIGSGDSWTIRYGTPMLPGNNYAFGNCTAYAFDRRAEIGRPIGPSWGNASSWADSARMNGFMVNGTPAAGAIIQNSGGYAGYGHVGIVEKVNPDGSLVISEMNASFAGGGFNIVSGRVVSAAEARSGMYQFIH